MRHPRQPSKRVNNSRDSEPMSYVQVYYHIVYSTKNRFPCMNKEVREEIFKYKWGVLKNHQCHLYRLGGVEDHVHLFTHLHPTKSLAEIVRQLKTSTTRHIRKEGLIENFPGWQEEYAAFTKSHSDKNQTIEYIKNQEEHHRTISFVDELKQLLRDGGIDFDERYLR